MALKGASYYMNGHMETQLGKVTIDPEVIATYAGSVAVECFGIVGMAAVNMKDGLVKLLKKDYLTHGINVVIDEGEQDHDRFSCDRILRRQHHHGIR